MGRRDKVVNYPKSIKKMFLSANELCDESAGHDRTGHPRLLRLLENECFPKGTRFMLFDTLSVEDGREYIGMIFCILLPGGEIFTGAAIKKPGDKFDWVRPQLIAAGRAIAVYRAYNVARCDAIPLTSKLGRGNATRGSRNIKPLDNFNFQRSMWN